MSGVATTTTSGATIGDQSAGLTRGSASGKVGKAQPPPPGQTLLFCQRRRRIFSHPVLRFGMIAAVVGIAIQEFLRKVRIIMVPVLIGGGRRPPRDSPRVASVNVV